MTAEAVPLAPAPEGWTIADVDALPENGLRYELVDGVPHVMNPPKKKHQRAAHRLRDLIERAAPAGVSVIEAVGVVEPLKLAVPFPVTFDPAVLLR